MSRRGQSSSVAALAPPTDTSPSPEWLSGVAPPDPLECSHPLMTYISGEGERERGKGGRDEWRGGGMKLTMAVSLKIPELGHAHLVCTWRQ